MDADAARALIAATPKNVVVANDILHGLNLIAALAQPDQDLGIHAEHDQIWAGGRSFEDTVAGMSEAQVRRMATWGWFEAEYCWSHFT